MSWLKHITPFRVAALAVIIFHAAAVARLGTSRGGVDGEGMSIIEFLFLPLILLFIDLVMHGFDVRPRILFWTQMVGLLAFVFWAS